MTELSSTFTARPGGVWTDEVGVITGELELHSTCTENGSVSIRVRYVGALDWYTVTGTTGIQLYDPRDHEVVHALLVNVLQQPRG
ncbi:MAG: hypothetical protein ACT4NY_16455 [Pseudonocardiales bacterium]